MILEHHSAKEFVLDHEYVAESGKLLGLSGSAQRVHHKPIGLWVSIQGQPDWREWCEGQGFRLEHLAVKYEVVLAESANVLILATVEEVRAFHREYCATIHHSIAEKKYIDWVRVAADYDGIIITPYMYSLRWDPEVSWYYSWDLASGCIWNTKVIERLDLK